MSFDSKWTPILAADGGFQSVPLTGLTQDLSSLGVVIPQGANCLWVQGAGGLIGFRLDGTEGVDRNVCMLTGRDSILELSNRKQIDSLVMIKGEAESVFLQFFTGRVGAKV